MWEYFNNLRKRIFDRRMEVVTGDPREIPRPLSNELQYVESTSSIQPLLMPSLSEFKVNQQLEMKQCSCQNCSEILDSFSDCAICMEPLQGNAIFSCYSCANVLCWNCNIKLRLCAFCRTDLGCDPNLRPRNIPLERLIGKLHLPCRNNRWGCEQHVTLENRKSHEDSCNFTPLGCPLFQYCGWFGESRDICRHLKDVHDVTLLSTNGITIEIEDFQAKIYMTSQQPRHYTISLSCYGHIFFCKVLLFKKKLILSFYQLGRDVKEQPTANKDTKFKATLHIICGNRALKGIVPISRNSSYSRELTVQCSSLVASAKNNHDTLKINILISAC